MTDGSVDLQIGYTAATWYGFDLNQEKIYLSCKQMVLTELQDFGLLL